MIIRNCIVLSPWDRPPADERRASWWESGKRCGLGLQCHYLTARGNKARRNIPYSTAYIYWLLSIVPFCVPATVVDNGRWAINNFTAKLSPIIPLYCCCS
ncbi:hypothetical protein KCP74_16645 [Salmonella enterica subsp. enterica]|nr:hypothetical protein KCP74_16645 [Salmonella enterica subsp. enterica]